MTAIVTTFLPLIPVQTVIILKLKGKLENNVYVIF